jgi:hypothetical protein
MQTLGMSLPVSPTTSVSRSVAVQVKGTKIRAGADVIIFCPILSLLRLSRAILAD